jgi:hypothetical protein
MLLFAKGTARQTSESQASPAGVTLTAIGTARRTFENLPAKRAAGE